MLRQVSVVDRQGLAGAIDGLSPGGFTPIGRSLMRAAVLLPPDAEASIVLLSDGEDTCGEPSPCAAAEQIHRSHPQVAISAVGFKTADEELACVARTTGGLYLTADDVDQLVSRLVAAQDAQGNADALTPTGLRGIEVGQPYDEIRATNPGFPA